MNKYIFRHGLTLSQAIGLFLLLLAGSIVVGVYVFQQPDDLELLTEAREAAIDHRRAAMQSRLAEGYKDRVSRCEDWDLFEPLTTKQPADLSRAELVSALELADDCVYYFADQRLFSTDQVLILVEEEIEPLASKLAAESEQSDQLSELWFKIEDQLRSQTRDFRRLSEIQTEYWRLESEYRLEEISRAERDQQFQELNREAGELQESLSDAVEQIRDLNQIEEEVWESILAVSE